MNLIDIIPKNLVFPLAGIYTLLTIFEIILLLLKKTFADHSFAELKLRVRSWWVMVSIFSLALLLGKNLSVVFLGLVSFLALKEYLSIIPTRRADRRVIFWVYMSIPLQYYFAAIGWYGMFIIFIPVYMFLLIPTRMIIAGETHNFLHATGTIHWGLMTTVYCLSHASYLLSMQPITGLTLPAGNPGLLLFLVMLTQINDVAQYCFGKIFGQTKIVPSVSPKKTTIGLLGGILTSVLVSLLIAEYLTPFDKYNAIIVGALISLCGFIGDVNISAVKRDMQVKDAGDAIPGHGGVLDRVDSLTFTAPIFFHFLNYYYF